MCFTTFQLKDILDFIGWLLNNRLTQFVFMVVVVFVLFGWTTEQRRDHIAERNAPPGRVDGINGGDPEDDVTGQMSSTVKMWWK